MGMKALIVAALSVTLLAAAGGVSAQAQERLRPAGTVNFVPAPSQPETGVFNLRPEDRRLRSLRIQATRGSAEIRSLTLYYANGESERVRVRQTLAQGDRTNLFRLQQVRQVRSIEVNYVPMGAVTLTLLADAGGPPPPPPAKWVDLGCKSVGFLVDKDRLLVDSSERFRSLRLRSTGYSIEMLEMQVRYANGSRDNFVIRQIIPSGSVTKPIDLRGERRRISQIEFLYRAAAVGTVKTKLCVEGLSEADPRNLEFSDDLEDVQ